MTEHAQSTERTSPVFIARCPEHGLHGERTECFICGGPVEQVALVPLPEPAGQSRSPEEETSRVWSPALSWLQTECARQDTIMGGGYAPDRDGVRMALSALEDELHELKEAWRGERSGGPQPHGNCSPTCDRSHAWRQTKGEAVQVAAIALRLVRDLLADENG